MEQHAEPWNRAAWRAWFVQLGRREHLLVRDDELDGTPAERRRKAGRAARERLYTLMAERAVACRAPEPPPPLGALIIACLGLLERRLAEGKSPARPSMM